MNDFKKSGPGGLRGRKPFMGGRPSSDAAYGAKKKFEKKPSFGGGKFSGKGDRGGDRPQMQLHKATCSNCKKSCEVPFKPDGTKPVLCRDCFSNSKDDHQVRRPERRDEAGRGDRGFNTARPPQTSGPDLKELKEQVSRLEAKVTEVLALLKSTSPEAAPTVTKTPKEVVAKKLEKKAVKKVTKKVAAKKTTKKK